MKREAVNPWDWGLQWSINQAEIVTDAKRHLHCSGQIAVKPDAATDMGIAVVSPGEMRGQMQCALDNVDAVLKKAGMTRRDLVSLRFFATDIDAFLEHYDVYAGWIEEAGIRPPQSLIGVSRLVLPDIVVEIEATAAQ